MVLHDRVVVSMAVQFNIPDSPDVYSTNIAYFKGIDLYNASANVEEYRSPEAPNMIRDEVGKVRKRMGYETRHTFPARINGVHRLGDAQLVHSGTWLYCSGASEEGGSAAAAPAVAGYHPVYAEMNDRRSRAVQFGGKLYLLDGKKYLVFDGTSVQPVSAAAAVPTVIVSRRPTGGGTTLQPLNLLCRQWTEQFLGTASDTVYQLTATDLDPDAVLCQVMGADGTWVSKTEGTDFTVDRAAGKVTFAEAPGQSPVTGMDNVKLTPSKTRSGYADRIDRCDVAAVFGVNGAPDRIFVTGNPEFPNLDYYSQYNDPTFFGDTWYCQLGQNDAGVVGYTILGNRLAAHKGNGAEGRNVIVREGTLDSNGNALFRIVNTLQGEGAISKYAFAALGREPLFLTRLGVYAITTEELTGEKYSQQRGLYLSSAIQAEADLDNAFALTWRDFYMLAVGGTIYVLDGLQKQYAKDAPYSNFQYEGYMLTGIDARVLWEEDGALWFGSSAGKLCRFFTDVDDPNSYNDDGAAILAYWDTPDLSGKHFWKNKTFRFVSVRLAAAIVTGVKIFVQKKGLWSQIYDAGEKARYFTWEYINMAKFVFSTDRTPRTLGGKIKVKKVDKARFRFQNGELNEPFGIYAIGLEYTEPGTRYKG